MVGPSEGEWQELLDLADHARALRRSAAAEPIGSAERLALFRRQVAAASGRLAHPLSRGIYAPLIARSAEGALTLAQVGQSIDGRIATESGHSHNINGAAGLDHLHRLRALVDAVVVGATTVELDDPQLTTRRVAGPNPVRVVIDPRRRLPPSHRVFDSAAPTLRVVRSIASSPAPASYPVHEDEAGVVALESAEGVLPPSYLLEALHRRALAVVLIEGGGQTISGFLRQGLIERLHVCIAPLLIGPGRSAFQWPPIARLDAASRLTMTAFPLGDDILLDCAFTPATPC